MMDSAGMLAEVERLVGQPPRRFSKMVRAYGHPPRARFAQPPDLTAKVYEHYRQTLKRGQVRWGAFVHANNTLYEPGTATSGGQLVYAEDGATLEEVLAIAERTAATKGTTPSDPGARKIADMLTDEMERALDWPLPDVLSGGKPAYTTVTMVHRPTVPDGFLGLSYFPVLADPGTKHAAMVPSEYWPAALVDLWREQTGEVMDRLAAEPAVTLTPFAADAVGAIASEKGLGSYHLRVWLEPDGQGFRYQMNLIETEPDVERHAVHTGPGGLQVAVPKADVPTLRGTVLDYVENEAGRGFDFRNPHAVRGD